MRLTYLAAVLIAAQLIAIPSYAGDWDTVIPPEIRQQNKPVVTRQDMTLNVWEIVTLPLPGNRSYSCQVEIDGDSVGIVEHDPIESVTLRGLKPGRSIVRTYRKFWRDPDVPESYVLDGEVTITVVGGPVVPPRKNGPAVKEIPSPRLAGNMDWEGSTSAQSEELITVIGDGRAWSDLWNRAFNSPAPQVDFTRFSVACVFLGHGADWLFGINFGTPRQEGLSLVIPYELVELELELMGPFRASGQYRMKAFEKRTGLTMVVRKTSPRGATRP